MEEVNVGGKKRRNTILETFAVLYCATFHAPNFRKSLKFFGTSNAPLDPELPDIRHVYKGCGPPEKLSLALVPRSYVLRMIVKLAYCYRRFSE